VHTFDRYLLREWFQIIGLVITALLGLLLVQMMYNDLPDLLNSGAKLADIAMYFGVAVPSFLNLLLPLTLLVSLLYVLGQMHRQHEFTALRAAGVSLMRIVYPVWIIGLLCCALTWWMNSTVIPWSVEQSRALKERLEFRQQSGALTADRVGSLTSVTFDNRPVGRIWFMNRFSRFTDRGYGVTVNFLDAKRRETHRIFAAQAWKPKGSQGWLFLEGREITFDPDSAEVISNVPFTEKRLSNLDEDPNLMLLIDRKPIDLSFLELQRIITHLEETGNPKLTAYAVRYHSLIADTLTPLLIIALAIPFAVSGVRVNPAVGISKSIGLFALYYLLVQVGSSLATKGLLPPMEAAWFPSIGMSLLALRLFIKLR